MELLWELCFQCKTCTSQRARTALPPPQAQDAHWRSAKNSRSILQANWYAKHAPLDPQTACTYD